MLEILRMNNLSLNQLKTKFILSYERGVKAYDIKKIEYDSISFGIFFIY